MSRRGLILALVGLCLVGLSPDARGEKKDAKKEARDLSEPVQANTVWKGLSHQVEAGKQKRGNPMQETSIKVTKREGETFEANYWLTLGANRGSHDSRGLALTGTIDSRGQIKASPTKILAGNWQNPDILNERWVGEVVLEKGKEPRIVLRRQLRNATIEIGVVKQ